jgi:hypothetical protein
VRVPRPSGLLTPGALVRWRAPMAGGESSDCHGVVLGEVVRHGRWTEVEVEWWRVGDPSRRYVMGIGIDAWRAAVRAGYFKRRKD